MPSETHGICNGADIIWGPLIALSSGWVPELSWCCTNCCDANSTTVWCARQHQRRVALMLTVLCRVWVRERICTFPTLSQKFPATFHTCQALIKANHSHNLTQIKFSCLITRMYLLPARCNRYMYIFSLCYAAPLCCSVSDPLRGWMYSKSQHRKSEKCLKVFWAHISLFSKTTWTFRSVEINVRCLKCFWISGSEVPDPLASHNTCDYGHL